jgi:hypothetical protein
MMPVEVLNSYLPVTESYRLSQLKFINPVIVDPDAA